MIAQHLSAAVHLPAAQHAAAVEHVGVSGPVGIPDVGPLGHASEVVDPTSVDQSADGQDDGLWSQVTDSIGGALDDVGDAFDSLFE